MKSPSLPKQLPITTLTGGSLRSHEELSSLRFERGSFINQQADHLVLEQIHFQGVSLDHSQMYMPKLTDIRLIECSLANTNCERMIVHRAEFGGCRLVGLNVTEGHFQDVQFRECDLQLARFRFCSFKSVIFDRCNLKEANFQGADLRGLRFKKCDLSNAEMSQTKLHGTDFRTTVIEGLRIGPEEVVGAVVDHFQAAYLASLLGLIIKSEDEE